MKMNEQGVVTLDEYELHDILCSIRENMIKEAAAKDPELQKELDCGTCIERFELVIRDQKELPKAKMLGEHLASTMFKSRWEQRINFLRMLMSDYDAEYHDDAEHTC